MNTASSCEGRRAGLIAFTGTTPNIGATAAAFGTAAWIAKLTDKRVGYLCLNLKSSKIHRYLGYDEPPASLDGLRPELRAGRLDGKRLVSQCITVKRLPNLFVLAGSMQREQAEYYAVSDIECLLQAAAESFDYCITDSSAYWDNAGTIATLQLADQRMMVTTQQLGHFQEDFARWCEAMAPVFGLSTSSFGQVVVQNVPAAAEGFDSRDVSKETGMARVGDIRAFAELPILLNQGRLLEAVLDRHVPMRDFRNLAEAALGAIGGGRVHIAERPGRRLSAMMSLKAMIGRAVNGH